VSAVGRLPKPDSISTLFGGSTVDPAHHFIIRNVVETDKEAWAKTISAFQTGDALILRAWLQHAFGACAIAHITDNMGFAIQRPFDIVFLVI
jgi:hypothetical protein